MIALPQESPIQSVGLTLVPAPSPASVVPAKTLSACQRAQPIEHIFMPDTPSEEWTMVEGDVESAHGGNGEVDQVVAENGDKEEDPFRASTMTAELLDDVRGMDVKETITLEEMGAKKAIEISLVEDHAFSVALADYATYYDAPYCLLEHGLRLLNIKANLPSQSIHLSSYTHLTGIAEQRDCQNCAYLKLDGAPLNLLDGLPGLTIQVLGIRGTVYAGQTRMVSRRKRGQVAPQYPLCLRHDLGDFDLDCVEMGSIAICKIFFPQICRNKSPLGKQVYYLEEDGSCNPGHSTARLEPVPYGTPRPPTHPRRSYHLPQDYSEFARITPADVDRAWAGVCSLDAVQQANVLVRTGYRPTFMGKGPAVKNSFLVAVGEAED
ncbi:hypothetical protein HK101_012069 [Irineochytrium annulatum]|nr:hypothetical protein HK101_012069 [Irineochytrium annulatum]